MVNTQWASTGASMSTLCTVAWVCHLPRVMLLLLLLQSWSGSQWSACTYAHSIAASSSDMHLASDPLIPRRLTDLTDANISLESSPELPYSEDAAEVPDREGINGVLHSIPSSQKEPQHVTMDSETAVPIGSRRHQRVTTPGAARQTLSTGDSTAELTTEDRITRLRAEFERSRYPWVCDQSTCPMPH